MCVGGISIENALLRVPVNSEHRSMFDEVTTSAGLRFLDHPVYIHTLVPGSNYRAYHS